MQNFYVAEVDTAISIVPNINRLAAACREKGAPVIWVIMRCAESEGAPSQWQIYHTYFFTDAKGQNHLTKLSPGNEGYEIYSRSRGQGRGPDRHQETLLAVHRRRFGFARHFAG